MTSRGQWKNVKRKTDRNDALKLATLAAPGQPVPVHIQVSRPAPVEGEEVRVPLTQAVGILLMGVVGIGFGGAVAYARWTGVAFGGPARQYEFTSGAELLGIGFFVVGILLVAGGVLLLLNRGALVLGHDRLQYVEPTGQLPWPFSERAFRCYIEAVGRRRYSTSIIRGC